MSTGSVNLHKLFDNVYDAELDQENTRLHHELEQRIAEQFSEFDLDDEVEEIYKSSSALHEHVVRLNVSPPEFNGSLDVGLSVLENAIQHLGEEGLEASNGLGSNENNLVGFSQSYLPFDPASTQRFSLDPSRTPTGCKATDVADHESPIRGSDRHQHRLPCRSSELTSVGAVINGDPSTEGRCSPYYTVLQCDQNSAVYSAQVNGAQSTVLVVSNDNNNPVRSPIIQPYTAIDMESSVRNDRRDILYAARGRQIEALQADLSQLHSEAAKEKRVAAHRLMLAEGEKQILVEKLASADGMIQTLRKELQDREESLAKLRHQLSESEVSKEKLTTELSALKSTNESLSAQLVELSTGDAVRRVEEREDRLTAALERRFTLVNEELLTDLQQANRRLSEKEKQLVDLERQLETFKAESHKARCDFNETIARTNKQLEETQQHCQRLASSAMCSEVTSLRHRLCEMETSRKITEDVNKILQDELQDLREQVSLYENVLKLDGFCDAGKVDDEDSLQYNRNTLYPNSFPVGRKRPKSVDHMVTFEPEVTMSGSSTKPRPASALERRALDTPDPHTVKEFRLLPNDAGEFALDAPRSCIKTQSFPKSGSKAIPCRDPDPFHCLSQLDVLTSTPVPSAMMCRLRSELMRCLTKYKAKREQVTRLHEVVFTTRCQLHQVVESSKMSEKNADALQDRVVSLERELANAREITEAPGPLENVLQCQLKRLKEDYGNLEQELQSTRTRLQTALGAEARALEDAKTANERLAASAAERDAAVERARAVCEMHYTSMRRRLESEWTAEREAATLQAEQMIQRLRHECNEREKAIQKLTHLYEDTQMATQRAVENALIQAMEEREAERIRFWREELPNQLAIARMNSDREWAEKCDIAVREAVAACEKKCALEHTATSLPDAGYSSPKSTTAHLSTKCSQTEMDDLLSLYGLLEPAPNVKGDFPHMRLLQKVFGPQCARCLHAQLIPSTVVTTRLLDKQLYLFIRKRLQSHRWRTWDIVANAIDQLVKPQQLERLVCGSAKSSGLPVTLSTPSEQPLADTICSRLRSSSSPDVSSGNEDDGDNDIESSSRTNVLSRLQLLVFALSDLQAKLEEAKRKPPTSEPSTGLSTNANLVASDLYRTTLQKIKQDVLAYVHSCQTRAAQTLHFELARVHRRACRQFMTHLRRALYDAGALGPASDMISPLKRSSSVPRTVFEPGPSSSQSGKSYSGDGEYRPVSATVPSRVGSSGANSTIQSTALIPQCDLESLLHIIDGVCAFTESNFQTYLSAGSALFSRSRGKAPSTSSSSVFSPFPSSSAIPNPLSLPVSCTPPLSSTSVLHKSSRNSVLHAHPSSLCSSCQVRAWVVRLFVPGVTFVIKF
ncbi:unnamed protein product [Dicrocoelium dendriticum]|nr:unnamed protein product [Dicrocoelium dendriticum]